MKTASFLTIATGILAVAYAAPDNGSKKAESNGDMTTFQNVQKDSAIQISKTGDGELTAEAYCGGFSYEGCSAYCYYSGYSCYYCSASWCNCDSYSC